MSAPTTNANNADGKSSSNSNENTQYTCTQAARDLDDLAAQWDTTAAVEKLMTVHAKEVEQLKAAHAKEKAEIKDQVLREVKAAEEARLAELARRALLSGSDTEDDEPKRDMAEAVKMAERHAAEQVRLKDEHLTRALKRNAVLLEKVTTTRKAARKEVKKIEAKLASSNTSLANRQLELSKLKETHARMIDTKENHYKLLNAEIDLARWARTGMEREKGKIEEDLQVIVTKHAAERKALKKERDALQAEFKRQLAELNGELSRMRRAPAEEKEQPALKKRKAMPAIEEAAVAAPANAAAPGDNSSSSSAEAAPCQTPFPAPCIAIPTPSPKSSGVIQIEPARDSPIVVPDTQSTEAQTQAQTQTQEHLVQKQQSNSEAEVDIGGTPKKATGIFLGPIDPPVVPKLDEVAKVALERANTGPLDMAKEEDHKAAPLLPTKDVPLARSPTRVLDATGLRPAMMDSQAVESPPDSAPPVLDVAAIAAAAQAEAQKVRDEAPKIDMASAMVKDAADREAARKASLADEAHYQKLMGEAHRSKHFTPSDSAYRQTAYHVHRLLVAKSPISRMTAAYMLDAFSWGEPDWCHAIKPHTTGVPQRYFDQLVDDMFKRIDADVDQAKKDGTFERLGLSTSIPLPSL